MIPSKNETYTLTSCKCGAILLASGKGAGVLLSPGTFFDLRNGACVQIMHTRPVYFQGGNKYGYVSMVSGRRDPGILHAVRLRRRGGRFHPGKKRG